MGLPTESDYAETDVEIWIVIAAQISRRAALSISSFRVWLLQRTTRLNRCRKRASISKTRHRQLGVDCNVISL